jgi:hypothetical protein
MPLNTFHHFARFILSNFKRRTKAEKQLTRKNRHQDSPYSLNQGLSLAFLSGIACGSPRSGAKALP